MEVSRKNHLLFTVTPFDRTKSFVASRTVSSFGRGPLMLGCRRMPTLQVNAYAFRVISTGSSAENEAPSEVRVQLDLFNVQGSLDLPRLRFQIGFRW